MSLSIKQNILRFQITIDYTRFMQILQSEYCFSCIELRTNLIKCEALLQVEEQLTSVQIINHEIQLVG